MSGPRLAAAGSVPVALALACSAWAAAPAEAGARRQGTTTVFVLEAELGSGVEGVDREALGEVVLGALQDPEAWKLVPQRDLGVFLGNQRQAEILGVKRECATDECLADLAGALGGPVLRTRVGRLQGSLHASVRVTSARGGVLAAGDASGPDGALVEIARRAASACRDAWRAAHRLAPAATPSGPAGQEGIDRAWAAEALARFQALARQRPDLARTLLRLTHPTGVTPSLGAVREASTHVPALEIDLAWNGRLTGKRYVTRIRWELQRNGHVGATVRDDGGPVPVDGPHREQLDAYFREQLFPAVRLAP